MHADHVRLQPEQEHRGERRPEPRFAAQQPEQHGEGPEDERNDARDTRVDAQLDVSGLAGPDLDSGALRDDTGVPEAISLRMVGDRIDPVPEVPPVAGE